MENATKALLIGAGMLFAVAIVSMMIYVYLNITGYYSEKQTALTKEQITEFNSQYEAYNRDDVTGFELVSLINKILDYNNNTSADGWEEMFISFTINITELDPENYLFNKDTYDTTDKKLNKTLKQDIIKPMQDYEKEYGAGVLSKLVSNKDTVYDYDSSKYSSEKEAASEKLGIKTEIPDEAVINKYEVYLNFKRAEFECSGTHYNNEDNIMYSTGRITKISFTQKQK